MRLRDAVETPVSRLRSHGVEALSDRELVSLVLGSGSRAWLDRGLRYLSQSETAPARLRAAFELGRRVAGYEPCLGDPIRDPALLGRSLVARYSHHVQERLGAVFLDAKNRSIREQEIYVGTVNSTTVSTRDVFRLALDYHAATIVLFHNHPSGDPSPSAEDLLYTKQVIDAGRLLQVEVLDHLIIGLNRFVSLRSREHFWPA